MYIYIYTRCTSVSSAAAATGPYSASLGLTDYSQVGMLSLLYNSINFGVDKSPGTTSARQRYHAPSTYVPRHARRQYRPRSIHSSLGILSLKGISRKIMLLHRRFTVTT